MVFLYLAIGKIRRHSSGNFEIDSKYIPPILHIQSNETLLANLKRTLNVVRAKIKMIQTNNRENEQKLIEFRSGDIVFILVGQCTKYRSCDLESSVTKSADSP